MARVSHDPPCIFISHSSKDKAFCRRLANDLRRVLGSDRSVWLDFDGGLKPGVLWIEAIAKEITDRNVFIVVLSPDALASGWVQWETNIALEQHLSQPGKMLFLTIIYKQCPLPPPLVPIQAISFVNRDYHESLKALLDTLPPPSYPSATISPASLVNTQSLEEQIYHAFDKKDWRDVARKCEYLLRNEPQAGSASIHHMYGWALFHLKASNDADKELRTALALVNDQNQRLAILEHFATVCNREMQWSALLECADEALELSPGNDWWLKVRKKALENLIPPPVEYERTIGSYRVHNLLSTQIEEEHILCEIYRGASLSKNTPVTIKLYNFTLTYAELPFFHREIGKLKPLDHPHMVSLLDYGLDQSKPYLILDGDYITTGSTLRERHSQGAQVPLITIPLYVAQITDALRYMHSKGVIHGNLRPESVLIDSKEEIAVHASPKLLLTDVCIPIIQRRAEAIAGKVNYHTVYMAPEFPAHPCDASDQYSLAIMIYEWLTGQPPSSYSIENMASAVQHNTVFPSPLRQICPTLPLQVEKALLKAFAADPEQRFPGIKQFADSVVLA